MAEQAKLDLGTIKLYFRQDFFDPVARMRVRDLGDKIADTFDRQGRELLREIPPGFNVGDFSVQLNSVFINGVTLEDGSIKEVLNVAAAIGGIMGGIAAYPDVKKALPIIFEDMASVVHHVASGSPMPRDQHPVPVDYKIDMKDEEDILEQIQQLRR